MPFPITVLCIQCDAVKLYWHFIVDTRDVFINVIYDLFTAMHCLGAGELTLDNYTSLLLVDLIICWYCLISPCSSMLQWKSLFFVPSVRWTEHNRNIFTCDSVNLCYEMIHQISDPYISTIMVSMLMIYLSWCSPIYYSTPQNYGYRLC